MKLGARRCNLCDPGKLCGYCRCDIINMKRRVDPYSREAFEGKARVLRAVIEGPPLPHNMKYEDKAIVVFDIPTGKTIARYRINLERKD